MVFSSILFLFRFLPVAFAAYYLAPKRLKNFVLLVVSLVFYSWGEAKYFPVMISCILVNYISAILIDKYRDNVRIRRTVLVLSCIFNLGTLGFFKYTNFVVGNLNSLFGLSLPSINLVLPLGISFYTFQTMSYTLDVYMGKVPAEKNLIDLGAFVVLFPQLIAGPIVRYTDIARELKERSVTLPAVQEGIKIFILGLGSKVLIANNVGALWTEVETIGAGVGYLSVSTPLAWLAVLAYSLQIFFDFNGYSLMAIGLGKMMGFEFPKNFDFPYISRSFTEFWRRWHMTLGSWFREYLYIPLGGNRVSKPRLIFNLFVVWAATGLWHGASWNFVLWGCSSLWCWSSSGSASKTSWKNTACLPMCMCSSSCCSAGRCLLLPISGCSGICSPGCSPLPAVWTGSTICATTQWCWGSVSCSRRRCSGRSTIGSPSTTPSTWCSLG